MAPFSRIPLLLFALLTSTALPLTHAFSDPSSSPHLSSRKWLSPRDPEPQPGRFAKTPKYFEEAGGSIELSHYDIRYFKGEVPYEQHRLVLRDLIKSYLTIMSNYGVETWLAHGTLLGWWWNGKTLPWDYDLDVQVSLNTLAWMTEHLNQTDHIYNTTTTVASDGEVSTSSTPRKYMVDINPHYTDNDKGDGQNIIDARWIDMENGMFIDITGLKERNMRTPGVWSCKNNHRYQTQDLWPMRTSEYEGTKAKIPYNFEGVLTDEYGVKAIVLEQFHDHIWDSATKEWVQENKTEEIPAQMNDTNSG